MLLNRLKDLLHQASEMVLLIEGLQAVRYMNESARVYFGGMEAFSQARPVSASEPASGNQPGPLPIQEKQVPAMSDSG